jgi:hypothetical protein
VALTPRTVGGLTTDEIAHAFLVPEGPWPPAASSAAYTPARRLTLSGRFLRRAVGWCRDHHVTIQRDRDLAARRGGGAVERIGLTGIGGDLDRGFEAHPRRSLGRGAVTRVVYARSRSPAGGGFTVSASIVVD